MIYADFNATTPLSEGALRRMELGKDHWGNPSSSHAKGRKANEIIEESRRILAHALEVPASQIVFTSGGSEANTTALLGSLFTQPHSFRLLTSPLEHSSIQDCLPLMQRMGAEVQYAKALPSGGIDLAHLENQLTEFQPHLVSLMTANNETGVVFPVNAIAQLCKKNGAVFHSDAVQALGKLPPNEWLGADLISISAHKIGGPKGAGALIVRHGKLTATHFGGNQEIKRRGGTENVLGILGFAGALSEKRALSAIENLRNRFEEKLRNNLNEIDIQGASQTRVPNTSNVRFHGVRNEVLLSALDLDGICISAGSACSSGSIDPSHVLLAMGLSEEAAKECARFSFGPTSTENDIETIAERVIFHVKRVRERRSRS